MRFNSKLARVVFCTLFPLALSPAAASESFEVASALDGAMGIRGYSLYSRKGFACGASFRRKADGTVEAMGGLNSSLFILGHLGDSGLASEVRNPGPSALARLSERTGYRADLRSHSDSRFGLCMKLPSGRAGTAWERREEGDFGIFWAIPVAVDEWKWETIGCAGLLNPSSVEDSWYPETAGTGEWPLYSAGSKITYSPKFWDFSATVLASCSPMVRPGICGAASARFSKGAWLARSRCVYASEFFRDAGGERADGPIGCSLDVKFAPNIGLGFDVEYEWRLDYPGPGRFISDDGGEASLVWRAEMWRIRLTADWNTIAFPGADGDSLFFDDAGLSFDRMGDRFDFGLNGRYSPGEGWAAGAKGSLNAGFWEFVLDLGMEGSEKPESVCVGLDWKLRRSGHVVIFSIDLEDLGEDWSGGPQGAGDFDASLRWIVDLR